MINAATLWEERGKYRIFSNAAVINNVIKNP